MTFLTRAALAALAVVAAAEDRLELSGNAAAPPTTAINGAIATVPMRAPGRALAGNSECKKGYFCNKNSCGSKNSGGCEICPGGKYSNKGSHSCKDCMTGTFGTASGAGECTRCAAGRSSGAVAATSEATCQDCDPGYFESNEGAASCRACGAAKYSSSAASIECTWCPVGRYAGGGSSVCDACPAGKCTD